MDYRVTLQEAPMEPMFITICHYKQDAPAEQCDHIFYNYLF